MRRYINTFTRKRIVKNYFLNNRINKINEGYKKYAWRGFHCVCIYIICYYDAGGVYPYLDHISAPGTLQGKIIAPGLQAVDGGLYAAGVLPCYPKREKEL